MSALARGIPIPHTYEAVEHTYSLLFTHMLTAMREINEQKPFPPRTSTDVTDSSMVLRELAKQAKRRSKVLYWRVKNTLLTPPSQSTLPNPNREIQRILQRNTPRSSTALDHVQPQPALPNLPPTTVVELRKLGRARGKKSSKPDGMPPYLLASLPDALFGIVHKCLTLSYEFGSIFDPWLIPETFCIFRGKGQWQDPDRGLPIAMSNSIHRLLMRWVYHTLYPLIAPQLHPKQFGGRQGSSTSHASQAFLQDLEHTNNNEAALAFDLYHAFDNTPKYLIQHTLLRMGAPAKRMLLISLVLARGATLLRGAENVVFTSTQGVKQGCLPSCFLFIVVFDIRLRFLSRYGITLSAYVDDIWPPAPKHGSQTLPFLVGHALSLIGCQVTALKSESLPLAICPPSPPTVPKYYHPPHPVQANESMIFKYITAPEPPPWSEKVTCTFTRTIFPMHLGHPIPAQLQVPIAVKVLQAELRSQLNELHQQPIQILDRVLLLNTMVPPRLLYRTECLPLSEVQTTCFAKLMENVVFRILGLPLVVATKTLNTHCSHGPGLGHSPPLNATRILDKLHRNPHIHSSSTTSCGTLLPYGLFLDAVSKFSPAPTSTTTPLDVAWKRATLTRQASSVLTIAGLEVYIVPSPHRPGETFTNGSKLGSPPASGAAALLPSGNIAVAGSRVSLTLTTLSL